MQKLLFVFVMLMGAFGFSTVEAQIAPTNSGIFFQAVARDNYSNPAKDRTVYVEASIIQNAANGTKVLTELFQTTTDGLGVFSISIGSGTRIGGTLSGLDKVDWANGPYFLGLKIAIKPLSPVTNWDYTKELIDLGASAFGTVPYAFYSASAASVKDQVKTTDTAAMLLPYAKKTDLALKVNLADSSTIYVTPTQLRAVKFDTTSIYASLNQKEILANKSINVTTDATSDVKYPSVRAVKSYVDLQFSNFVIADGSVTSAKIANGAVTDAKIVSIAGAKVTGDIAGNAATATLATNATRLATPRTINGVAFDGTSNITIATGSNPIDADANTKGIVQLTGDLTGTAAQPLIANGAVTNAKIADVAATKITGAIAVANGGTGATTAAGARTNLGLVIGTDVLAQRSFGSAANNSTTDFIAATDKGANNGVATLGNDGKIPSTQIPAISFQSASVIANQAAMLALTNQQVGSIAIRTDNNKNYVLSALPSTTLVNWVELATPSSVSSVNGNAGPNVVLTATDIAGVEIASNKSNDIAADAASTTKFPTVKSIKDYVDQQSANAGVADNSITSAKINGAIAIAKGGTGAITAAAARTNLGLVIGTDVMSATATTTLTGDVTGSGNGSFATTINSVGGVSSSTIASLPTTVNANTASITAEITRATNAEAALDTRITSNTASITANANNISTLTTNVNANTASITAEITRATNAEAALDTRITSNTASITAITADILLKAPINSPTFTGTPTAPTPATSDNSTKVATTEYVKASITAANAGLSSIGAISGTSNAKGATISGTTELILTPADATNGGVVTTGAQTFAGAKTFNNDVTATNFLGNATTATTAGNITATSNATLTSLTNLNTVGTITTGTWSGTAIALANGGTGATTAASARTNLGLVIGTDVMSANATTTLTGDVTGSGNGSFATTLAASGVSSGTYGSSTAIPTFTVDSKGRLTAASTVGIIAGVSNLNYTSATSYVSGGTISGTSLTLAAADANNPGLISTDAQTIAGAKTFSSNISVRGVKIGIGQGDNTTNTVLGGAALVSNTSGTYNTAIGGSALFRNSTGSHNIAAGQGALENSVNGNGNAGFGSNALFSNTSGSSNTALGISALYSNSSGEFNTAIGNGADVSSGGLTNATAIGYGAIVGASNRIQLGNSSVTSVVTSGTISANGFSGPLTGNATTATTAGNITATSNTTLTSLSNLNTVGTITSGTWSGTTIAVANGGTGGTTAAGARANLGLVIGTDVMSAAATTTLTGDVTGSGNGSFATTINSVGGVSSSTISTFDTRINTNTSSITTNTADILTKAPIASPTFTGTPTAPTPLTSDNSTKIATTEYVKASITASNAGLSSIGAISGTSNAKGATISGTTELILTPADATNGGVVTTGLQTFAGAKTFSATTTFNDDIKVNDITIGVGRRDNSSITSTALGKLALGLNTTGSGNTALGQLSMSFNTTGGFNSASGSQSLGANTTGSFNTAFGNQALSSNTTGTYNTAIGFQANVSSGNLTNSTAIGNNALVTASNTIQLGNSSVTSVVTSGTISATGFTGPLTGNANTATKLAATKNINGVPFDGSADITIAINSNTLTGTTLASNVINSSLTSVGTITTGVWSGTAIAIANGGTGSTTQNFVDLTTDQTIAGAKTFSSNISVRGVKIGIGQGDNTTNTVLGGAALVSNTSGTYNTAIGGSALFRNSTGSHNIAAGQGALENSVNGTNNAAMGSNALFSNTSGSGNSGFGIGGLYTNTTGDNNTSIGYGADVSSGGLTNATAIGYGAIVGASNRIQLGNSSVTSVVTSGTISATGFTGPLTGNASTATKLAATKNINGVAFDGSANITIAADANTLTGTTLASNVVNSSLTSVGTITTGVWSGTTIAVAKGGTGATTKAAAFDALSPMSTSGDIIYGGASGTGTRLAKGTDGQVLTLASGIPSWAAISAVTSLGTFTTTAYAAGGTINGSTLTLSAADGTKPGLVSTVAQTIAGAKTFSLDIFTNNDVRVGKGVAGNTSNTVIGKLALGGTSTVTNENVFNTAIGISAMQNSSGTGSYNTAVGANSAFFNNSGSHNTYLGYQTGYSTTSGTKNVAIGSGALYGSTTGNYLTGEGNNAIGFEAMKDISTTASDNIAIGLSAGTKLTTGNKNIFIGSLAGKSISTGSSANTTGLNSVLIGYDVRPLANADDNEIVISGYNGSAGTVGLGSNTTLIGSSTTITARIMGALTLPNTTASSSSTTGALIVSGGTGIAGALNVGGATTITGAATISNTTASTSSTTGALIVRGGVGVAGALNVAGNTVIAGTIEIDGGSPGAGKVLTSDATGIASWQNSGGSIVTMSATGNASSTASYIIFTGSTASQTITIPSAVTLGAGRELTIKNVASVSVSIASAGGNLIQDNSTLSATTAALGIEPSNNWMKLVSDGTNWYIFRALF